MEGANGQNVGKNQKGKNDSGGFLGRHNLGHENNREQAEGPKARFGKTSAQCRSKGDQPGMSR